MTAHIDDLWYSRGDMSKPLRQCGHGRRWRVRVEGYRPTLCRTRDEAQDLLSRRVKAGPPSPASTVVMSDLVARWMDTKAGLSKGRLGAWSAAAARVRNRWGHDRPGDIINSDVKAWLGGLEAEVPGGAHTAAEPAMRPASPATKSDTLQCLEGALRIGVELGALTGDEAARITDGVSVGKREKKPLVFLTPGEVDAMAEFAGPDDGVMIWFMAGTGLRISEACSRDVRHIDAKRRRVTVTQTKSKKVREAPIPQFVLDMLDLGRPLDAPLFPAAHGGRRRPDNWRTRVFNPAAASIGRPELTPHDLRHTAVSWAVAAGADVLVVQEMLGHASATRTLDIYGHLWARRYDEVANLMEDMVLKELAKSRA